ncbi:MAG: methylmalonyl Co-A mutase-associated GTPase MeaB [Pseudomonadota bacterium]
MRTEPTLEEYVVGVLSGDRAMLARAITLTESRKPDHQKLAEEMLLRLLPQCGNAHRVGISGVPGVGKSTFIDALGTRLTADGHRVAVLAVDPTSNRTGGSILGDKTRMEKLSRDPNAYIRPSPTAGTLGGVARRTREAMHICEAAGFDVILVETVGVGQSEVAVSEMVDFFLVLAIAGAGDELQGIKRGILELADMIAVNKADGDNKARATRAASEYANAMHLITPPGADWVPPVVTCRALQETGLAELWNKVLDHRERLTSSGELAAKRKSQMLRWMWTLVEDRLISAVRNDSRIASVIQALEADVVDGNVTPSIAADRIMRAFGGSGADC